MTPKKTYPARRDYVPEHSPLLTEASTSVGQGSAFTSPRMSPKTSKFLSDISDMPEPKKITKRRLFSANFEEQLMELRNTIRTQSKELKKRKITIEKLRRKLQIYKNANQVDNLLQQVDFNSESSKIFTKMQMKGQRRRQWEKDEKEFSILSYYKSPGLYKYWRNKLGIVLPGLSTIKNWIGRFDCLPGFSRTVIEELRTKTSTMNNLEKYCTLVFDEISIKQFLEYNKKYDFIEGLEDFGDKRTKRFGTHISLFMVRGIYSKWKLPFAYFISSGAIKKDVLVQTLTDSIKHIFEIGLNVRALICDQGKNNQAALRILGISTEKTFIQFEGRKIYVIFDALHLVKNFRNNFLYNNYIFEDKVVDFQDIVKTYEIDQSSETSRCLLKLSHAHLNPDSFQKMNCSLATQIFSHSVAAAIRTCIDTQQLTSYTAPDTAKFVEFMNNLFDTLNSKQLYSSNPFTCALNDEKPLVKQTMINAISKIERLFKITKKGNKRPDCFNGMLITLKSVIALHEEQKVAGFPYLLTNRLNQDVIENTFAVIRQRGGFNANPTARTFRASFKILLKTNLLKSTIAANCEDDVDSILLSEASSDKEISVQIVEDGFEDDPASSPSLSNGCSKSSDEAVQTTQVTLQDCANVYFAGYLAKKCIDKFNCSFCKERLLSKDEVLVNKNQLLILHKSYRSDFYKNGLKKPHLLLTEIVKKSLRIMKKIMDSKPHAKKISKLIRKCIYKRIRGYITAISSESCREHLQYLIDLLITAKIHKECKWMTIFSKKDKKKRRKVDLLQNI